MQPHITVQVKLNPCVKVELVQCLRPAPDKKIIKSQPSYFLQIFKCTSVTEKVFIQDTVIVSTSLEHFIFENKCLLVIPVFFAKFGSEFTKARANIVKYRIMKLRKGIFVCKQRITVTRFFNIKTPVVAPVFTSSLYIYEHLDDSVCLWGLLM